MTSALDAAIVPITLTVNGRTGVTLFAPPWEDADGEEWMGFLGDGAKILLYPSAEELAAFIASGAEHDLSDHPTWGRVARLTSSDLEPSEEDDYDASDTTIITGKRDRLTSCRAGSFCSQQRTRSGPAGVASCSFAKSTVGVSGGPYASGVLVNP